MRNVNVIYVNDVINQNLKGLGKLVAQSAMITYAIQGIIVQHAY